MRKILLLGLIAILIGATTGLFYGFYSYRITHPDANGIIHNPIYGDYPAEVPFSQGMTLYPGQSADLYISIPFPTATPSPSI